MQMAGIWGKGDQSNGRVLGGQRRSKHELVNIGSGLVERRGYKPLPQCS